MTSARLAGLLGALALILAAPAHGQTDDAMSSLQLSSTGLSQTRCSDGVSSILHLNVALVNRSARPIEFRLHFDFGPRSPAEPKYIGIAPEELEQVTERVPLNGLLAGGESRVERVSSSVCVPYGSASAEGRRFNGPANRALFNAAYYSDVVEHVRWAD